MAQRIIKQAGSADTSSDRRFGLGSVRREYKRMLQREMNRAPRHNNFCSLSKRPEYPRPNARTILAQFWEELNVVDPHLASLRSQDRRSRFRSRHRSA